MKIQDENKFEDVIQKLKKLKRVDAPANFESDLKRRINAESNKTRVEEKKSVWGSILLPSRLIPSLGLGLAAAIVFMVININSEEMEDPFQIEPKVRKDIVEVVDYETVKREVEETEKNKSLSKDLPLVKERRDESRFQDKSVQEPSVGKEESGREELINEEGYIVEKPDAIDESIVESDKIKTQDSTITAITESPVRTETTSEVATGMAITKEELNFRQVQLNEAEQQVVDQLRTKVMSEETKKEAVK
jgi:hypothetical protein